MPQSLSELEIGRLTVPERLELIGQLWDSIPDEETSLPVPEWHRQEVANRLARANETPDLGIPWETTRKRLRNGP